MADKTLIIQGWEEFAEAVLDPTASELQRAEMRMAYVCGAFDILTHLGQWRSPEELAKLWGETYAEVKAAAQIEHARLGIRARKGG